jgi:uncharacterized protein YutE (UPF0331/DUF86 family)
METVMRKIRVEAVDQVAARLFAAEAAIDIALAATSELSAAIPQARTKAHLSAFIGQEAMECTASSLTSLVEARNRIVAAHGALDRAKTEMGLRTHAFGGGMLKPFVESDEPNLRLVDRAAA